MSSREQYLNRPPNPGVARRLTIANALISIAVLMLVGLMRKVSVPVPEGWTFSGLPAVYSGINMIAAIFLIVALICIRRGNVLAHRRCINAAMICSLTFLLMYVAYHITSPPTEYGGTGYLRVIYFLLLVSHIVLAAVSLPFILQTWIFGVTNQFDRHRRLARWVFPVWLYVAVSGPVCYWMLRPYYGAS